MENQIFIGFLIVIASLQIIRIIVKTLIYFDNKQYDKKHPNQPHQFKRTEYVK